MPRCPALLLLPAVLATTSVVRAAPAPTPAPPGPSAEAALRALFAEEWERSLREEPERASALGDRRYDDRWTDLSPEAIAARQAADRAALARLRAIDRGALSPASRLDRDTLEWQLSHQVERQRFREELLAVSQFRGPQAADAVLENLPWATAADYRAWLGRLRALPRLVEQTTALLRAGAQAGLLPPRVVLERASSRLAAQQVDDPTRSPFYRPLARFPEAVPAAEREPLAAEARRIIAAEVVPAFRRLSAWIEAEYLPRARASVAAADLPEGLAYYDFLVRFHTSTDLGAEEIHAIGLREVARLRARLEGIRKEVGFAGDLAAFFHHLRTDPRFFYPTPEALLQGYRALAKRIDPELVRVARRLPRQPYGVRPIPDRRAPDAAAGYYSDAALDGSRAGHFDVNLHRPDMRPRWGMVPLTLHEAVPGHHFQSALAQEAGDLPLLRRTTYFTACAEGWALYAELLGYDMGLYDDPYDRFGQLTDEMLRAVRLVVDTGLHARGWSRDQAIAYFRQNCALTEVDVVAEVDRYIADPGQALGYKIGQLRISALRARGEATRGARFDLKAFHDELLSVGSVPIAALERHMEEWLAAQAGRPEGR